MDLTKKTTQKTSGTRKKYKPGQLVTIENCVFRIEENRFGLPDCYVCNLDLYQQRKYCDHCILHNIQNNLQGYYFELVKCDNNVIHTSVKYKPGQLITICKDVFRIRKNTSVFTDCCMCNLKLQQQKQWCRYCMDNLHFCYFELVKKHKG